MKTEKLKLVNGLREQRGLSLIEVLIALLVLSIGMVGLGAMLLATLSNVHSSSHYSLASALALDLEERLWFEVAEISARDPGALNNGCLTNTQIGTVRDNMVAEWNEASKDENSEWSWTSTQRMRLPGLVVRIGNDDISNFTSGQNANVGWQTIALVISWDEARFDDVADAAGDAEEFTGDIGVICRPTYT